MKEVYTLKLEGKEWKDCLDKSFKKEKKDLKVDGFRKGQVPEEIFIKKFGIERLYTNAIDYAVDILYARLMKDPKTVVPVATPSIDIKNISKDMVEIEFTIVGAPEVKLGKYKSLGIKKEEIKVTEEEVKHELNHLKEHFVDEKVAEDNHEIKDGDIAVIDFEGFLDGKAFDGGKGSDYPLTIGSHTFIPGFEEGVVGLKKGDSKDLDLTFPENYGAENLKGKKVVFKVTVKEVKERVFPEFNKDFFDDLGIKEVTTLEELKKYIEENIKIGKKKENEDKYLFKCLDKIVSDSKFEIPEEMTNDEVNRMVKDFENKLKYQGLNLKDYLKFLGKGIDEFKETLKDEANKRIGYRLILDEIVKAEKLDVTEEELEKDIEETAKNYGISKEEFIKEVGSKDLYKYDMLMKKAMKTITE